MYYCFITMLVYHLLAEDLGALRPVSFTLRLYLDVEEWLLNWAWKKDLFPNIVVQQEVWDKWQHVDLFWRGRPCYCFTLIFDIIYSSVWWQGYRNVAVGNIFVTGFAHFCKKPSKNLSVISAKCKHIGR